MVVLQVNCVFRSGSTGKIVQDIHTELQNSGHRSIVCYGRGEKIVENNVYKTCSEMESNINHAIANVTGLPFNGLYAATRRLIQVIEREKPDVVHLHCINGYFVNIYRLLSYLKTHHIPTVLTLHAEFMYTGGCGYAHDCERWMTGCGHCPHRQYATGSLFFDRTRFLWSQMYRCLSDWNTLSVVSVSPWLENRAAQSPIMKNNKHSTVLNGVDTSIFTPSPVRAKLIQEQYSLQHKKVILHVTPNFQSEDKGGAHVLQLARECKDPSIAFVVIGNTQPIIDQPDNLLDVGRIMDQKELAAWYSLADLTVLTSRKETFSMICAETLCCGTPVVGFEAGAPEMISLKAYSQFVPPNDRQALHEAIMHWVHLKPNLTNSCACEAAKHYSRERMSHEYFSKYTALLAN